MVCLASPVVGLCELVGECEGQPGCQSEPADEPTALKSEKVYNKEVTVAGLCENV